MHELLQQLHDLTEMLRSVGITSTLQQHYHMIEFGMKPWEDTLIIIMGGHLITMGRQLTTMGGHLITTTVDCSMHS